jgi:uncharacterized protein
MDYLTIIEKYYIDLPKAKHILIEHSKAIVSKAKEIAGNRPDLILDLQFVEEATMIHDIGMFKTNAPDLGCYGKLPYICHGYLGRELIENEGFPKHALVCERHTGTGLSKQEIIKADLPIPIREMMPVSIEEKLICLADKFFSKSNPDLYEEKTIAQIEKSISKYGDKKVQELHSLLSFFGL